MPDDTANLILEQLRVLRNAIADVDSKLTSGFAEVNHRLSSLEKSLHRGREDTAQAQEDIYRQQTVIDQIKERLDRIERRLELS